MKTTMTTTPQTLACVNGKNNGMKVKQVNVFLTAVVSNVLFDDDDDDENLKANCL